MSDFETYEELLSRDPHERLAWLAHSVQTPFTAIHRDKSDDAYDLLVRDIGERLAAGVIFDRKPEPNSDELLVQLRTLGGNRRSEYGRRFLEDELALAHAATVAKVCIANFYNWQEYFYS